MPIQFPFDLCPNSTILTMLRHGARLSSPACSTIFPGIKQWQGTIGVRLSLRQSGVLILLWLTFCMIMLRVAQSQGSRLLLLQHLCHCLLPLRRSYDLNLCHLVPLLVRLLVCRPVCHNKHHVSKFFFPVKFLCTNSFRSQTY